MTGSVTAGGADGSQGDGRPFRAFAVLASLCFGRFCMGLQLQTIASLTPFLMTDLGFSYSQIGLLIGLFLAPGVLLGMPGSLLGHRFGYHRLGVLGVVLMAAGSLWLAFVDDFWGAAAARFVAGTGGILVNITFLRLVTQLFDGKAMNRAIAVVMSSWPVGLGLAAVTYPALAEAGGWRLPLWLLTGVTLAAALCVGYFVKEPARRAPAGGRLWSLQLDTRSWQLSFLLGCAFAAYTAGGIVFLSFAPPFLMTAGLGLTEASAAASLIVWLGLLGTPLGGLLADRLGGARLVIYLGALGSALLVALVTLGYNPMVLGVAMGIIWGLPAAPFTGLLQRMLPPQAHGAGYGLYFTLFYCGFFGFPAVAGWLIDITGDSAAPLWFGALLLAVTSVLILLFYRLAATPADASAR